MALFNPTPNQPANLPNGQAGDFLIVAEGRLAGNRLGLPQPAIHLGSDSNCDIWLPQEDIRPWHALLFKSENLWNVKSLDPAHPVVVNGSPVTVAALAGGDRIALGRLIFVLESLGDTKQGRSTEAEKLQNALRIHASALSAAHMEIHQNEGRLAEEKRRWKIRCGQIAKELSRRQDSLRKKAAMIHRAAQALKMKTNGPIDKAVVPSAERPADDNKVLAVVAAIESRTREQRRRLARAYWSQRQSTAKRFIAWEKALARREAALERSWQALVAKHKKQEQESSEAQASFIQRENAFHIRLLEAEQSLQVREKALKEAEKQSAIQNRRISEETERLRASQRDWITRLETLHREENGLKRRVENLAAQLDRSNQTGPSFEPRANQGNSAENAPSANTPQTPHATVGQTNWALILSESLAILSSQRETLVRQAEALAARDLEWMKEHKAAAASMEDGFVSLAHQEQLLAEKHAQLDRLLEENAGLQRQLEENTKALRDQRRQELENAAGLHTRLIAQESFLEERKERLRELEKSVEQLSARQHAGILQFLDLAREAANRAEAREKSLVEIEKDLRLKLEDNQYHWQSMALERAELEALRAELLSSSKLKSDVIASRLREARTTAAERTAGWLRLLEDQQQKLARQLEASRATWSSLADLLDELEANLKEKAIRRQAADLSAFALLRQQEEAAFWREEMERLNSELSARKASSQEPLETIPIPERIVSNFTKAPAPQTFRAA